MHHHRLLLHLVVADSKQVIPDKVKQSVSNQVSGPKSGLRSQIRPQVTNRVPNQVSTISLTFPPESTGPLLQWSPWAAANQPGNVNLQNNQFIVQKYTRNGRPQTIPICNQAPRLLQKGCLKPAIQVHSQAPVRCFLKIKLIPWYVI